jgi:hypothetical protein
LPFFFPFLSFALLLGGQMGAVCLKSETGAVCVLPLPLAVSFSHRFLFLSLSRGRFPASPARLRQDFRAGHGTPQGVKA